MQKQVLINNCIAAYKKTLKQDSKFFAQDVENFTHEIQKKNVRELVEHLERLEYYQSKAFESVVNKEVNKLQKGGMFNIKPVKK